MSHSDPELVRGLAALARLELSEEEVREAAPHLQRVLEAFRDLSEVTELPPAPEDGGPDFLRTDEPRPSLAREEALANAPEPREGFFGVPKTLGGPATGGAESESE